MSYEAKFEIFRRHRANGINYVHVNVYTNHLYRGTLILPEDHLEDLKQTLELKRYRHIRDKSRTGVVSDRPSKSKR